MSYRSVGELKGPISYTFISYPSNQDTITLSFAHIGY